MENEEGGERPVQKLPVLLHTNSFCDFYLMFLYLFKFRQHSSRKKESRLMKLKINDAKREEEIEITNK